MAKSKKRTVSTYDIELTFMCESCQVNTVLPANIVFFNDGPTCRVCGKRSDMRLLPDAEVTIN